MGLVILLLFLAWRWRIRDLIKRALIVMLIPFLYQYFLKRSEDALVFQQWTLVFIGVVLLFCVVKAIIWVKNIIR